MSKVRRKAAIFQAPSVTQAARQVLRKKLARTRSNSRRQRIDTVTNSANATKATGISVVHQWLDWAERLFNKACEQAQVACERRDSKGGLVASADAELARDFISSILQVHQLLNAFEKSPKRDIDGTGGVADQLDLSRNGVYLRMKLVGLTPNDFRFPGADLEMLAIRSPVITKLVERMEQRLN